MDKGIEALEGYKSYLTPELEQRIRAYAERLKINAAHYLEVSKKDVPFYDKAQARAPYDKMLHPSDIGLLLELFNAQNAELEQYRNASKTPDEISIETATIIAWGLGFADSPGKIFKAGYDRCRADIRTAGGTVEGSE
ncbi:hypothetical protein [Buttiauxella sp.]|uniref:hypothetical protein n=1 Tax=Buttiauxella sp. TaxID=1972222 RepID=UPI003C74F34F